MLLRRPLLVSKLKNARFDKAMSASTSYSAAASRAGVNVEASTTNNALENHPLRRQRAQDDSRGAQHRQKRSPSPAHIPSTEKVGEDVYVLTLLTDQAHHKRMTGLRDTYFPKHLNKLGAHLTLFHALPGSRLDDHILPTIRDVASKTGKFPIHAVKPFRLKHGVAISVAKNNGSTQAQEMHRALQRPWLEAGFLSDQDQGGCRVHYTVMNKVDDDAKVAKALGELQGDFRGDWGVAEGLGLWRYERGYWKWQQRFDFGNEHHDGVQE